MNLGNASIAGIKLHPSDEKVSGGICKCDGEDYYKIENYNAMPPFLMSIVSDSDLWMFISSNGGLTAGRKNADYALFPYYTDDKINASSETTGSKTIIRLVENDQYHIWHPFSASYNGLYKLTKNLYKNLIGNCLIFEEMNHDLQLTIRIKWMSSDAFGWVRKLEICNMSETDLTISMLDGLQNILPYGILKTTQESFSTLMDAYKKSECHLPTHTGIFSMSSIPVDRAEPSEALMATTVWTDEKNIESVLLGNSQLCSFQNGGNIHSEQNTRGISCNYFIETTSVLKPESSKSYLLVADVCQDSSSVNELIKSLGEQRLNENTVLADVQKGRANLLRMVAESDGIQQCNDKLVAARHFSNVLFNIMRGGIYSNDYSIKKCNLIQHIHHFNKRVSKQYENWLNSLPETLPYPDLIDKAFEKNEPDLIRLLLEYLPLTFSRRHGDPSRPWNRFTIEVKNDDGSRSLAYEGNWRDIFQNWEALSFSYPAFLQGIIARFLNASTPDGYNPYRITHSGIDWEIFDPSDPWSFIGYWGDHQIIYMLKLLELQEKFYPGSLLKWVKREIFVYANVPYRIKPYDQLIKDPRKTIDFNEDINSQIARAVKKKGADAKLIYYPDGSLVYANLIEKILVSILTKLSNFIPGAGIWMNTQRPEWNDANNALVGNGVSMVTLCYIRRFMSFLITLLSGTEQEIFLAGEVYDFFLAVRNILDSEKSILTREISDQARKKITDRLGHAGSDYRDKIYAGISKERKTAATGNICKFCVLVREYIDHTISSNQRNDGLYTAYNLIEISPDAIKVSSLQAMLEGQVAILSSGNPDLQLSIELLENLRKSDLFREDQQSYILYPDKDFKSFLEINNIPEEITAESSVIKKLLKHKGAGVINQDENGIIHFCGQYKNAEILEEVLLDLKEDGKAEVNQEDISELLDIYEQVFKHHAFTGRTGSFFKYEGLGSIYWHMVSKLRLAVAEILLRYSGDKRDETKFSILKKLYEKINEGLGIHKNPVEYGAIPTDPYSHTPSMLGAQQPGMTGQVKEDIISRWIELGIDIRNGEIHIRPELISKKEFDSKGKLSFTFCKVPFNYIHGNKQGVEIIYKSEIIRFNDLKISMFHSHAIFNRSDKINAINIYIQSTHL